VVKYSSEECVDFDNIGKMLYRKEIMSLRLYTTREVTKRAGVSRQTLQTWIAKGKVKPPGIFHSAGLRLWTEADLAKVLKAERRKYRRTQRQSS
jgi:transposase